MGRDSRSLSGVDKGRQQQETGRVTVPRRSSLRQERLYQDIIGAGAAVVLADYLSVFPSFKNTGFLLDQLYGCNDISLIYVGSLFFLLGGCQRLGIWTRVRCVNVIER